MNAEEALELTYKNSKRKEEVKKLIKNAENSIKSACERGKRDTSIYAGYVENGIPQYEEVIEHFKNLGYRINSLYGTNLFEVRW